MEMIKSLTLEEARERGWDVETAEIVETPTPPEETNEQTYE